MADTDEQEARDQLAANLRRLRERTGMSQENFAVEHGISRSYIGRLERGTNQPTFVMLLKIARALDVEFSELFEGIR